MPCADPRRIWLVDGKWTKLEPLSPSFYESQEHGCGQCACCRQADAAEWTTRLYQEGQMHHAVGSICATLTYDPEHLPELGSLRRVHAQAFMKALRKRVAARGGPLLSFDCTGEYSPPPAMRPHYHVALFSYCPPDWKEWAKSRAGNDEYTSSELTAAWGRGLVTFQSWSVGAAKYVAGHQAWKLTGDKGHAVRMVYDEFGQAVGEREREFHACSTRPGIGRRFFEAYGRQALELGFTIVDGKKAPVPAYYLRRGDLDMPELAAFAREERTRQAAEAKAKLEGDYRLDAIEFCAQERINRQARKSGF